MTPMTFYTGKIDGILEYRGIFGRPVYRKQVPFTANESLLFLSDGAGVCMSFV